VSLATIVIDRDHMRRWYCVTHGVIVSYGSWFGFVWLG
jgi:hypothetical protein